MRISAIGKHDGKMNGRFGTHWYTNPILKKNLSIKEGDPVQEGFKKGRKNY